MDSEPARKKNFPDREYQVRSSTKFDVSFPIGKIPVPPSTSKRRVLLHATGDRPFRPRLSDLNERRHKFPQSATRLIGQF